MTLKLAAPFARILPGFVGAALLCAATIPASADKFKNPTAVFAGLDKITGRIIAFEAAVDETVQFGSLQLTARVCFSRDLADTPRTTTFIEVDEVGIDNQYRRIFSGWMIAQSPSLNAVEHPVYDVWLTDCKGATEADRIKTPPELDEDEQQPPQAVELRRNTPPKPVTPIQNRPQPNANNAAGAPLRLPTAAPEAPRPAPQQRFFPTNQPAPRGGYDPAGNTNR